MFVVEEGVYICCNVIVILFIKKFVTKESAKGMTVY